MERTVVALFDDVNSAQRALEELLNNGFDRSDISVVRTNTEGEYTVGTTTTENMSASGAAAGVGIGAALGGIAGLVVGLGVLAIPGIGPIVAAGPLATTLAGAGIGAAAGGIIGVLTDVGIPESEAGYYVEGVRRGGTLLTVRASESQVSQVTEVLNRFSPVDVNQRSAEWRSSGWSGFDPNASAHTGTTSGAYAAVSGAGMRDTTQDMRQGAREMGRDMERGFDRTTGSMSRTFDDYDRDFRRDWERSFQTQGYGYERFQPAYRYGHSLATENRYRGRNWNDIEVDARRDWEARHPGEAWDDYKDAVRHAWQRVRADVRDAID